MIIDFSVENFRSFKTQQVMSFRAHSDAAHQKTHCVATGISSVPRLVRSAMLVGPNASGKTNFLAALRVLREMVVQSGTYTGAQFANLFTPFYGEEPAVRPTVLAIDVLLDKVRYQYCFAYNSHRIVFEELSTSITKKPQRWYRRQYQTSTQHESWASFSSGFHGPRAAWKNATRPQALMLTTAARLNAPQLKPLMTWFEQKLDITVDSEDIPDMHPFARKLRDPWFKARTLEILAAADFPALDVRADEHAPLPGAPVKIEFLYGRQASPTKWLSAKEFSSGAGQLVRLIAALVSASQKDRFVAIDEFDTHLHPSVTRALVQSLTESTTDRNLQLLAVTHNLALLDLEILRRDEIWLMNARTEQGSQLKRLSEHSPRRHESIARAYMRGRYDSLPALQPSLLEERSQD